jgi:hypothetical protein
VFCTGTSGAVDLVNAAIQPDIQPALSQKACKPTKRIDKQENTYETDPMFQAFAAALAKPAEKLLSAEAQYDLRKAAAAAAASNNGGATSGSAATAALQELMKDNPLLKYMREKAEKKLSSRRLGKGGRGSTAAAGGTGVSAKGLKVTALLKKNRDPSASGGGGADTGTGGGGKDKSRSSRSGKSGKGERPPRKERETGVRTMCFPIRFLQCCNVYLVLSSSILLFVYCFDIPFVLRDVCKGDDPLVDVVFWTGFNWFSFSPSDLLLFIFCFALFWFSFYCRRKRSGDPEGAKGSARPLLLLLLLKALNLLVSVRSVLLVE